MERNFDEIISEMLIELDQIRKSREEADKRMEKFDKRLDLAIKRLVKSENRMEGFDKKLELSIKDQKTQSQVQAKANAYFLKQLTQHARMMEGIVKKNGLKH
jgi:hypothetical protein